MSVKNSDSQTTTETQEQKTTLGEALSAAYDESTKDSSEETTTVETKETGEAKEKTESTETVAGVETEVVPPEHWSDEDKQAFLKMDENGRQWALRLESNYHKGIQEKSEQLKRYTEALEPYKPMFNGADEAQVIKQLLNAQAYLQRDPVNGLKWLMQNLQVDPSKLTESQKQEAEEDEFVDPAVKKLRAELKALKDAAEQQQQQTVQQQRNAVLAEIAEFRDETSEAGEKLRPHFAEVYGVMAGLLQSGRAQSLQDAYDKAVWAVPEYRDSFVQKQVEERQKAEAEKKAKEAEEAKSKAKTVQGKHSAKGSGKPETLRGALEEAYDKSVRGEL